MPGRAIRLIASGAIALLLAGLLGEAVLRLLIKREFSSQAKPGTGPDIFVVGGSSARGVPYAFSRLPPFGLGQIVTEHLFPDDANLQVLARDGESIYPQTIRLIEALDTRRHSGPGFVLIYAGHNKYLERDGTRPAESDSERRRRTVRQRKFWLMLHSRLLGRLIVGVERALNLPGRRDLDHYEFYLRRAIEASRRAGLTPIVSTVAGNVAGIEPCLSPETAARHRPALDRILPIEKHRECETAVLDLERIAAWDPALAPFAHHYRGHCSLARGDTAAAKAEFETAYDGLGCQWGRASAAQNALVRNLAGEYRIPLVDAVRLFEERSPDRTLSNGLFADGQHPNLAGHYLLADGFAAAIAGSLGLPYASMPAIDDPTGALRRRDGPTAEHRLLLAHLHSAFLLTNYAVGQGRPESLLAFAHTHVMAALGFAPDSFQAWVLRGLIEAREIVPFIRSPEGGAWFRSHGFTESYSLGCGQIGLIDSIAARYREIGTPPAHIERMLTVAGSAVAACHDWNR